MKFDEEKGYYCNGDDLFFQCWQTVNGWKLDITNLRTGRVHSINEYHEGMFSSSTQHFRFLMAASYVPALDSVPNELKGLKNSNVWNPRSGASLRNVVFDNIYIARYNASDEYYESDFEEFYPGSDNMIYGFAQGSDCSSMIMGNYDHDGTEQYVTGENYKTGDRYVSFSCYYDGGGHYHEED